jgi:hypothetical protein
MRSCGEVSNHGEMGSRYEIFGWGMIIEGEMNNERGMEDEAEMGKFWEMGKFKLFV